MFWEIFESSLSLLTGIGIFLVGIVMFSDCLEKNASKGMRALFNKISNKRSSGLAIGAGVTAIIQSSSATTVMVIGLVNAGIITLFQATSIIMGANIGTTVTGLMVSLSSFSIKYIFMALAFVGAMMKVITKKEGVVKIADLLISFGILFVGLELMGKAFKDNADLRNAFGQIFQSMDFPLLLVLLGAIFTGLIQSSSASTAIFITLIGENVLTLNSAIYLVLGANIGTCVTALLASFTANTNSKRAALIHILFNTIGAMLFLAIMWPLADVILPFFTQLIPDPQWQLSVFHVIFNVSTTLILIWFIKPLNKLTCFLIKEKPGDMDIMRTSFIDMHLLSTPSIAIEQTTKEINDMSHKAQENIDLAFTAISKHDLSLKERILKIENQVDFLNESLARYLVKISACPISYSDEKLIGGYHHVINDVERISDHAVSIMYEAQTMKENNIKFTEAATEELNEMYGTVTKLFSLSLEVFNSRDVKKLKDVAILNHEVKKQREALTESHIKRLNAGLCTVEAGGHFYATIMALKRVSDHVSNIAFTLRSYTGNQTEALRKIEHHS